ncbi:MAG: hypothetical protein ACJ76I_11910 [Gaiellaceae bacterium]
MVEIRSYAVFGSGAVFQQHASVNKPIGLTVGDLLLFSAAVMETIAGYGATVANSSAPASFTDLLLDGAGAKLQYILDPVSAPRWAWWLGWKWADAGDVAASTFLVDIDSGLFGGSPVGASNTHLVLAALTGFDATTPFGDTGYQNDIPGLPIPIPDVTSDEGLTITGKYATSFSGGLGKRSFWAGITHAADGTEEMMATGEAINSGATMVSGTGMLDALVHHQGGSSSFLLGRGAVMKPLTVHLKHPQYIGHDA